MLTFCFPAMQALNAARTSSSSVPLELLRLSGYFISKATLIKFRLFPRGLFSPRTPKCCGVNKPRRAPEKRDREINDRTPAVKWEKREKRRDWTQQVDRKPRSLLPVGAKCTPLNQTGAKFLFILPLSAGAQPPSQLSAGMPARKPHS